MISVVRVVHVLAVTGVLAASALCAPNSLAQQFPVKPIRIISPTAAGGVNDTMCRIYAQQISESVGQRVIVENRPGAGSMIGMQTLAKSPPDGYSVAVTTQEPLVYNPLLFTKLLYDPENDFLPVAQISESDNIIIASASAPASTFPELVAYAKANPGRLNFATWGPGSVPAIYNAWINRQNGIDIQPIAYKGAAPSIAALMSGEVQLTLIAVGFVTSQLTSGKLKAITVVGSKRSTLFPNIPALAEFNSDPDLYGFFGVYAPAKTPPAIIERLSAEFVKATRVPAVQSALAKMTQIPIGGNAAEFAVTMKRARASAARIFAALGIRPTEAPE
jgi:tripartite-type tricarboxylate transporter receptor subunit TctC